jgi:hypothetical protein
VKPRETFLRKVLFSRRLKLRGLIEGADMKMRFRRPGETFAGQGRSASSAKSAPRSSGRGIELGYLAFGNGISPAVEHHEDSDRRASMLSTALAMTPYIPFGSPVAIKRTAPHRQPPSNCSTVPLMILILIENSDRTNPRLFASQCELRHRAAALDKHDQSLLHSDLRGAANASG